MSRHVSRPVVVVATAVLALALVAVLAYVGWSRGAQLEERAALLPAETLRVTWTDWSGIRAELDATGLSGTGPEAESFLAEATDRDLTAASPTAAMAGQIDETFGFNPLASEWELLGQSREGMVLVFRLADDVDLEEIADRAEALGFTEPADDEMSGGVWQGGADVLAGADGLSTPELQHLAFLEDDHLVLASDNADYLRSAVPVARGDEDGLDLAGLADPVEDPLAAIALTSDYACEALAMSAADEGAQATAEQLVDDAGGVSPLTGYLAALQPDGHLALVFDYETDDQADEDARARGALAAAEDPGQMVAYPELFEVEEAAADGDAVVVTGSVVGDAFPLSNLTQGPVLVAAC
jgi:hypothetical protein